MKLLALVLLLSAFSSLTLTEVVKSFSETCPLLFIKDSEDKIVTPTVLKGDEYKQICQRWKNMYRFATLYDTKQRIPVYSAFIFTDQNNKRNGEWKNEPQLENPSYTANMKKITVDEIDVYYNQAVDRDYAESNTINDIKYTRGHVFPRQYAAADSTFTFTNVAPQTQHSNSPFYTNAVTHICHVVI
ncbi:endonuclease domain-containing 1 protein-like isoform X2 [Silurus meridionalis]|uniref:endonuclease domain-containing 1 protein-like isoform X2 n=1 Tax=Silurus meridionalis TaxID=175797 RepID=UPI001EECABE5|nr:endonuclease domain-containing 1 protein-like isoform X2 [Silurus meridionalis]